MRLERTRAALAELDRFLEDAPARYTAAQTTTEAEDLLLTERRLVRAVRVAYHDEAGHLFSLRGIRFVLAGDPPPPETPNG